MNIILTCPKYNSKTYSFNIGHHEHELLTQLLDLGLDSLPADTPAVAMERYCALIDLFADPLNLHKITKDEREASREFQKEKKSYQARQKYENELKRKGGLK